MSKYDNITLMILIAWMFFSSWRMTWLCRRVAKLEMQPYSPEIRPDGVSDTWQP